MEIHEHLLADREVGLDWIDLRDRREDGAGSDEVSDLHARDAGDSTHQRCDFRELQVEFGLLDVGLRRQDQRLRAELRLNFRIELALGRSHEPRPAACRARHRGWPCQAVPLPGPTAPLHDRGRPEGPRIDLEEHLAFPDHRSFPVVLLDDVAGDSRLYLRVHVSVQRGDPVAVDRRVALNDGSDFHGWRRRRGCRALPPLQPPRITRGPQSSACRGRSS